MYSLPTSISSYGSRDERKGFLFYGIIRKIFRINKNEASLSSTTRRERMMEIVSFISIEDDPPDLILSFAISQPELDDIRSLILMRTPDYEFLLDETERGVKVSDEAWLNDEDDMLKQIELGDDFVRITTSQHQFELNLKKIDKEEIKQAKTFLKQMNFDNCFEIKIV